MTLAGVLRVTLDTGAVNRDALARIEAAIAGRDVELAHTTVTDREQEETGFAATPATIVETGVWDESRWVQSVWGDDESAARLETILDVIGDGGFPPPGSRDALSEGQHHQLRDAMNLNDHARESRDVFVTNDVTAFVKHGRRAQLETLCSTKIMTVDEFVAWIARDASPASPATPRT